MIFHYKTIDANNQRQEGFLEAKDECRAREEIENMGGTLLELEASKKGSIKKQFKVRGESVTVFFRRLETLLAAGIPLVDSIEFLSKGEANPEFERAIKAICLELESGNSLSKIMRGHRFKRLFSSVAVGMIQTGEQTGDLARSVSKIADQMERDLKFFRSITSALTYPFFQFAAILAMGTLFVLILGPDEGGLFATVPTETPWPTLIMQKLSKYAKNPLFLMGGLSSIMASYYGLKRYFSQDVQARLKLHGFLLNAPGLGPLLQKIECSRMLYVMADGISVGLPVSRCMHMAKGVCKNDKMVADFARVIKVFSEGAELHQTLSQFRLFPPMVISMIEVGVESGELDLVMRQVCKVYDEDVELALDGFAALVGPFLMMFAGGLAAFLALATMLPLSELVAAL